MSTRIFQENINLDTLQNWSKNTMVEHLGIELLEIGDNYVKGKMPVDQRTHQPLGLLHGGASVALAETLGSIAATLTVNTELQYCVGLEINANHIKSAKDGWVYGIASPIHIGKKTQVWEIKISNKEDQLICISRITMAVMDRKK